MATAVLELSSNGLLCIGCSIAGLGAEEAEGLGAGLKVRDHPLFMNATAKK